MPNPDTVKRLTDARVRARAFLDDLLRQQAEFDAAPPKLTPHQLRAGRQSLANAVDAARQLLHSIDQALARAKHPT